MIEFELPSSDKLALRFGDPHYVIGGGNGGHSGLLDTAATIHIRDD